MLFSIRILSILSLCLLLQAILAAQAQPDTLLPAQKYHIANFRVKLTLREVGLNLTPFVKRWPWLSIGGGYRFESNLVRSLDCVWGEITRLDGSLQGPFVTIGYDPKNTGTFKSTNYSALIGYNRMDGGRVEYIEAGCFGGASSQSDYKLYDATANEVFFKLLIDFQGKRQWVSFYIGLGGGFQLVRKAFIESGPLDYPYADDDIEKILYFKPLLDFGLRVNLFVLKTKG